MLVEPNGMLLRFASVGGLTTAMDFALFSLLVHVLATPLIAANVISYSSGIATSFFLNRIWTFGLRRNSQGMVRHAVRFLFSNLGGIVLSTALVAILAQFVSPLIAKCLSIPLVFVWNFYLARYWVFR
ncbi:MAG: GtrA family protein [Alphaproteobacteria bacterium]|nr:GtrA family protein [Alphaproteobacteria bacterium]